MFPVWFQLKRWNVHLGELWIAFQTREVEQSFIHISEWFIPGVCSSCLPNVPCVFFSMGCAFKGPCRDELFGLEANGEIRGKREEKSHTHVAQTSEAPCNNKSKQIAAHEVDEDTLGGLSCLTWSVADSTDFLLLASVCVCVRSRV